MQQKRRESICGELPVEQFHWSQPRTHGIRSKPTHFTGVPIPGIFDFKDDEGQFGVVQLDDVLIGSRHMFLFLIGPIAISDIVHPQWRPQISFVWLVVICGLGLRGVGVWLGLEDLVRVCVFVLFFDGDLVHGLVVGSGDVFDAVRVQFFQFDVLASRLFVSWLWG